MSSDRLGAWFVDCRRVNSGVRFLLNAVTQESESVILHVIEAQELSCMWMLLEGCEPRAESAGRGSGEMNRHAAAGSLNDKIRSAGAGKAERLGRTNLTTH